MKRYTGEILILCSTLAWGLSYIFTKTTLQALVPFNVIAFRFTTAFMATALVFQRRLRLIGRSELGYGLLLGIQLFASSSLLAAGLNHTTISNAGFIIGSMVLFVAIMDSLVAGKKPYFGLIAGIILALAGIAVLTLRDHITMNTGDLYCLGATLTLSTHVMTAQRASLRADPVGASIAQFIVTGILAWAASLVMGVVVFPEGRILLSVVFLGVVGTAIAFVCQVAGQKYVPPTRTAFLFTLEPVFATLFAWLFLNEQVTWHVFAGGGLLLSGVYVSGIKPRDGENNTL